MMNAGVTSLAKYFSVPKISRRLPSASAAQHFLDLVNPNIRGVRPHPLHRHVDFGFNFQPTRDTKVGRRLVALRFLVTNVEESDLIHLRVNWICEAFCHACQAASPRQCGRYTPSPRRHHHSPRQVFLASNGMAFTTWCSSALKLSELQL